MMYEYCNVSWKEGNAEKEDVHTGWYTVKEGREVKGEEMAKKKKGVK